MAAVSQRWVSTLISAVTHWMFTFPLGPISALINLLVGQSTKRPLVGREALRGWITTAQAMVPAIRFSIEVGPLVDGALIAVRWRADGPHGQTQVSFTGTDLLRVAEGRIAELWANADTMLKLQQAGLLLSA